jgi:RimJ/RimL family protein N-acetyltransferase
MADVDWTVIETWIRTAMARNVGYRLEVVDGVFPEHLRADAAVFHHIMQTAPREDLDAGDVMIDADFVAELDRALVESGRARWSIFVRDPTGRCIGGTEVIFEPGDSGTVFQQNTGIDSGHRGLGLAKWVKAAMLQRMQYAQPAPLRVRTGNASSNAAMLAINEALGFKLVNARTEWQADAVDLVKALC